MSMSLNRSVQGNLLQNTKSFSYFRLFCIVSKQIHDKKNLKLQQHHQSVSIANKVEQDVEIKEEPLKTPFQSVSSAFTPFIGVEYQDLFAQEDCQQKRPLNIVNKKSFTSQSQILFNSLKKLSHFRRIILLDTIVLARYNDSTIWPGKIVNVQIFQLTKETKYRKVCYDVELINKNRIECELRKNMLAKFNEDTVGMLREFARDDKQLLKALKVAQKLCQQDNGKCRKSPSRETQRKEERLNLKIVKNIILKGQQLQKSPKLQENLTIDKAQKYEKDLLKSQYLVMKQSNNKKATMKWQPLNLVIQTPNVSLSYNSQQKEDKSDPSPQIQIQNSESQQISYERSVDKIDQLEDCDETHFSEYDENGIEIGRNRNEKDEQKEKLLDEVVNYLSKLKREVQRQPTKSKKYKNIGEVLNLLDRPLFVKQDKQKE